MATKRVKESFCYWDSNSVPHDVPAGSLIDTDRVTFYKGREHLFEDVETFVDSQYKPREYKATKVEDTSADPGTARDVSTVKKEASNTRFQPPTVKKDS
jgi:hypothetical protein